MTNKVSSSMVDYLQGGTGSTTRSLASKLGDVVSVLDFDTIQEAIDAARHVVFPRDTYTITASLTVPSDTYIDLQGSTIQQTAAFTSIFALDDDATNIRIENGILDCNDLATSWAIQGDGNQDVLIQSIECIGWANGLVELRSSATQGVKRATIRNNYIHTPESVVSVNDAIVVRSTTGGIICTDVDVEDNVIEGTAGEHAVDAGAIADVIVLQGVNRFRVCGNTVADGGENGISVVRLSSNGVVSRNRVYGCDADGIQVGSAFIKLTMADASSFAESLTATGGTSGASSVIGVIDGNDMYMTSVTGGKFAVGETVTDTATGSSTITAVTRTENILITDNIVYNNCVDAGGGTPSGLANYFIQQADNIVVSGNLSYDDQSSPTVQDAYLAQNCDNLTVGDNTGYGETASLFAAAPSTNTFRSSFRNRLRFPETSAIQLDSSGSAEYAGVHMRIESEGASGDDTLETITGGQDGDILILTTTSSARDITINHSTVDDGFRNQNSRDIILTSTQDKVIYLFNDSTDNWEQLTQYVTGDVTSFPVTSTETTGGAGSAGAGNQYVEMVIDGVTYKVLHDGTV